MANPMKTLFALSLLFAPSFAEARVNKFARCESSKGYSLEFDARKNSENYGTYTLSMRGEVIEQGDTESTRIVQQTQNQFSFFTTDESVRGPAAEIVAVIRDVTGLRAVHLPRKIFFQCGK